MKIMSGIYKIINLINGHFYIGSAKDIQDRWKDHRSQLNRRKHHNIHLENAWHKYGKENFMFIILEIMYAATEEQLLAREDVYINMMNPEYNIVRSAVGGDTMTNNPRYEELCENLSRIGKEKYKNGWVPPWKGKPLSAERKEKLLASIRGKPAWNRGLKHTPKTKTKLSNIIKKQFQNGRKAHFKGKKLSEETKRKISESLKCRARKRKSRSSYGSGCCD